MATPSEAWKNLTDEKNPTNWVILGFDANKKLAVLATGEQGLEELKGKLDEKEVHFAAIKVVGVDVQQNVTSKRPKYVGIQFVGQQVPALKKGLVLRNKAEVDKIMNGMTCQMQFSDCACPPPELTHKAIGKTLLAAGGAHKPVYYDFGPENERINLSEL